jgi:hypothetical protein
MKATRRSKGKLRIKKLTKNGKHMGRKMIRKGVRATKKVKVQKRKQSRKRGGMPQRRRVTRRGANTEDESSTEPESVTGPTSPVVPAAPFVSATPAPFVSATPAASVPVTHVAASSETDKARAQLKQQLAQIKPMFRDYFLLSDEEKASGLAAFKKTQADAASRHEREQEVAQAKTPFAYQWAVKSHAEREATRQQFLDQQEAARLRFDEESR